MPYSLVTSLSMIAWSLRDRLAKAMIGPFTPVFEPLLEKKPYMFSLELPGAVRDIIPIRKAPTSRIEEPPRDESYVNHFALAENQPDVITAVYSDGRVVLFLLDIEQSALSIEFGREIVFLHGSKPRLFQMTCTSHGKQIAFIDDERDSINFI